VSVACADFTEATMKLAKAFVTVIAFAPACGPAGASVPTTTTVSSSEATTPAVAAPDDDADAIADDEEAALLSQSNTDDESNADDDPETPPPCDDGTGTRRVVYFNRKGYTVVNPNCLGLQGPRQPERQSAFAQMADPKAPIELVAESSVSPRSEPPRPGVVGEPVGGTTVVSFVVLSVALRRGGSCHRERRWCSV